MQSQTIGTHPVLLVSVGIRIGAAQPSSTSATAFLYRGREDVIVQKLHQGHATHLLDDQPHAITKPVLLCATAFPDRSQRFARPPVRECMVLRHFHWHERRYIVLQLNNHHRRRYEKAADEW